MSTATWAPWCNGSPDARTSMDLWSLMFMSVSKVLKRTVAPASQHRRAKLLSVGQALVQSLPELPHAALCLPSVSSGGPHPHRASTTQSGGRSRSNTRVRKSCGLTTNSGPVNASLEPGPEWDRKWAWSAAHDWRRTMVSRKWCSEMEGAWNCQPCCHSPGSELRLRGGRAPHLSSAQLGRPTNPQRSRLRGASLSSPNDPTGSSNASWSST